MNSSNKQYQLTISLACVVLSILMQDRNETQEQGDRAEESQVYNKDLFI